MKKRLVALMLVLLVGLSLVLTGCTDKTVTEDDLDRIATYYFDKSFGDKEYTYKRENDTVINAVEAFVLTGDAKDGSATYTIGIRKDGGGVFSYGIASGKAVRIGGSNVGE